MHPTNTSAERSVVNELENMSLRTVHAWYGTFRAHIQTAYKITVPVPSQKARTVPYF